VRILYVVPAFCSPGHGLMRYFTEVDVLFFLE